MNFENGHEKEEKLNLNRCEHSFWTWKSCLVNDRVCGLFEDCLGDRVFFLCQNVGFGLCLAQDCGRLSTNLPVLFRFCRCCASHCFRFSVYRTHSMSVISGRNFPALFSTHAVLNSHRVFGDCFDNEVEIALFHSHLVNPDILSCLCLFCGQIVARLRNFVVPSLLYKLEAFRLPFGSRVTAYKWTNHSPSNSMFRPSALRTSAAFQTQPWQSNSLSSA